MTSATSTPAWTGGAVTPVRVSPNAADPAGDPIQTVVGGTFVTPAAGIAVDGHHSAGVCRDHRP